MTSYRCENGTEKQFIWQTGVVGAQWVVECIDRAIDPPEQPATAHYVVAA